MSEPGKEHAASTDGAAARWLVVHDELLRGMAHALSNRIATVGAVAYMLENHDAPVEQIVSSLRDEATRLEKLLQLMRALSGRPNAEAEPATANEACAAAIAMHAHHPDLRDTPCDVFVDDTIYPIWAEPHSFGHALLVALTSAKRNSANGSRVSVRVTGDNEWVTFRAAANEIMDAPDALAESDANAALWLVAPFGGTARAIAGGCEVQVPTLLAARKARKR